MDTAERFADGEAQASHLPTEDAWRPLFESLALFSDDVMDSRAQPPQDEREELFA